jgi:hypothetical protein
VTIDGRREAARRQDLLEINELLDIQRRTRLTET